MQFLNDCYIEYQKSFFLTVRIIQMQKISILQIDKLFLKQALAEDTETVWPNLLWVHNPQA